MEDVIFQIYGTLILTLAGFVLPILTIAVSAFPEGIKLLRQTYENEQKQAEKNLGDELQKQKSSTGFNYDSLERNIKILKIQKKKARNRLLYLSPRYILSRSVITVGVCIVSFLSGLIFYNQILFIPYGLFILSLISFAWTLVIFSNSVRIIVEASTAVQDIRRAAEEKKLELLTILVDNSKKGDISLFINQKDIHVVFNDEEVASEEEYAFSVNKKHPIKIALKNSSEYMLKTAELGFTLPTELLIEGGTISSTYTGEKEKIIRFKYDYLQSRSNQIVGTIWITFLKTGIFDAQTFVKGENLKNKSIKFKIKVID